jgi:uroporphyrinogen decarboxylase
MKMDMQAWKQGILASRTRCALPILTNLGFDLTGATVRAGASDGRVQAAAIQALARRYAFAASPMMMDLSVEAEAFGARIRMSDHEVPVVVGTVLQDCSEVAGLKVPTLQSGRIPQYLEAARLTAQAVTDRPVLAGCIGPFSLAGRLFGMTEIMTEMLSDPDGILALLETCTGFLETYAAAFAATGVNGLVMAEPAAGLLSPAQCDAFSSAFVARLVRKVQNDRFAVVLHNCGNTGGQNASMRSTGAWGLHFGNKNDLSRTLAELPGDVLVMGNVDPAGLFRMGTPEQVRAETARLLEATAAHPNFVLSSGCDIPPLVPAANVDAFQAALDAFNAGR